MQKRTTFLALILIAFVFLGAGCIQFKGSKNAGPVYGVWKSVDGGEKWERATKVPTPAGVGSIAAVSVQELALDPSDRFALYLASDENGMLYTYDGAAGWTQVREPSLSEGRVRAVAVDPKDKCTVYVTRGQRLYKSEDCSRTFNSEMYVDNRASVILTDVEVDWFNSDIVYLTTTEGEVLKSSDGGRTWATAYRAKSHIRDLAIDTNDSRILLVATSRRGVHRSADGGLTWTDVLPAEMYKQFANIRTTRAIVQDDRGDYTWAVTEYGLIVSRDRGATWAAVPLVTPPGNVEVSAIAVNPRNGAHVAYAAGQTLYITQNGGVEWSTQKNPTTGQISSLIFDPVDERIIYLGSQKVEDEAALF